MLCFELKVNGKIVGLIGRAIADNYETSVRCSGDPGFVELFAWGSVNTEFHEVFHWGRQELKAGDEVSIRIVESKNPDQPLSCNKHELQTMDRLERNMDTLENKIADSIAQYRLRMEIEGKESVLNSFEPQTRCCSFCGSEESEVNRLLGDGSPVPSICICEACVTSCNKILSGQNPNAPPTQWTRG